MDPNPSTFDGWTASLHSGSTIERKRRWKGKRNPSGCIYVDSSSTSGYLLNSYCLVPAVTSGSVPSGCPCIRSTGPLISYSPGFSLNGSPPPLIPPSPSDDAAFRQFMMHFQVQTQSELTGIKMMVNNLYLACFPLIVQSANRSTSTHQEVTGTKSLMESLGTAVKEIQTSVQEISAHVSKTNEFSYEPYSTKEEIDSIDLGQDPPVLATAISSILYDETDPMDDADLSLPFYKRKNKAKTKWLVEAILHKRMVSGGPLRATVQKQVAERITKNAGERRRAKQREDLARGSILRIPGKRRGEGGDGETHKRQRQEGNRIEREEIEEGLEGRGRDGGMEEVEGEDGVRRQREEEDEEIIVDK